MGGADPSGSISRQASMAVQEEFGAAFFLDHGTVRAEFRDRIARVISDELRSGRYQVYEINIQFDRPQLIEISDVDARDSSVYITNFFPVSFSRCKFREVSLRQPLASNASIVLKNSEVKYLRFEGGSKSKVSLYGSVIYRIYTKWDSLGSLICDDTAILDIDCPVPGEKNPFCGSASFSRTFLPRSTNGYPIEGAQPYRNMRFHLAALQNAPATALFHSAEQAIERESETWFNRLLSWLYEEFSDYGASPVLPLVWIGLLWLLTTTVLFASGVDIGGAPEKAVGWQVFLYEAGWKGDLLRAVILGFQPISWLGTLISSGHTVPLVPNNFCAQIWLVIDGILSTVLLALFIFALRRRFRMAS